MIEGLLGKKIGMTELFEEDGTVVVSTVVRVGPCYVIQAKNNDKDGYASLQIGFEEMKAQRASKAMLGHFKKTGVAPMKHLREIKGGEGDYKAGDEIKVADVFKEQDEIDVAGVSKGKGFSGAMERHGFSGQPASHGGMAHRRPGSIGQASYPGKVWKGIKMPGQLGNKLVTVQGLKVVSIDSDNDILIVKGSVPGPNGGILFIKHTTKGSVESAAA